MGHSAGALEVLDGMLYSFDHPEQSSTDQGRPRLAKQNVGFPGSALYSRYAYMHIAFHF